MGGIILETWFKHALDRAWGSSVSIEDKRYKTRIQLPFIYYRNKCIATLSDDKYTIFDMHKRNRIQWLKEWALEHGIKEG